MSESLFREDYSGQTGALRVDKAASVVHNVKILGWKSRNRRNYRPEGIDAAKYEGAFVNVDHDISLPKAPPVGLPVSAVPTRPVTSRFARLTGVTKKDDGLYAESLQCNPGHPFTAQFLWWAENCPDAVVLSHMASGPRRMEKDGSCTVLSIDTVHSVDVVSVGGSNATLYESLSVNDLAVQVGEHVVGLFPESTFDEIKDKLGEALSTPAEFSGDLETALAELRGSTDKRVALLVEAFDAQAAAEAVAEKRTKATQACIAAKIPTEAITSLFVESLVEKDEADWPKYIDDRRKLVGNGKTQLPKSGNIQAKPTAADFVRDFYRSN